MNAQVKIEKMRIQAEQRKQMLELVGKGMDAGTQILSTSLKSPGTALLISLGVLGLAVRYKQVDPVKAGIIAALITTSNFLDAFSPN